MITRLYLIATTGRPGVRPLQHTIRLIVVLQATVCRGRTLGDPRVLRFVTAPYVTRVFDNSIIIALHCNIAL